MKNFAVLLLIASLGITHCTNDGLSLLMNRPFKLNQGRVAGGDVDWSNDYGFQVQLKDLGQHVCGAVLIDEKWALTSGTCVNGRDPARLSIESDSTFAGTRYTTATYAVGGIIAHPDFSAATMANNLALVSLSTATVLNNKVGFSKATLPESGQKFTDFVNFVGYGSISPRVPREEGQKRVVSLPIAALTRCRNLYSQNLINSGMICAGNSYTGKGVCQGDAGSGATQLDSALNVQILVGIGSFGFDCGNGRYPSVFTAVADYVPWIRETANLNEDTPTAAP